MSWSKNTLRNLVYGDKYTLCVYVGNNPNIQVGILLSPQILFNMVILEKNLSKEDAHEIEENMGKHHAYLVNVVKDDDGTYMVVGGKEEKECYDNHWWQWDDEEE
jgi:hypothetical protein